MSEEVLTNEKPRTLQALEFIESQVVVYSAGRFDITEGTQVFKIQNLEPHEFDLLANNLRSRDANMEVDVVGDEEFMFNTMKLTCCSGKLEFRIFSNIYQKKEAQ